MIDPPLTRFCEVHEWERAERALEWVCGVCGIAVGDKDVRELFPEGTLYPEAACEIVLMKKAKETHITALKAKETYITALKAIIVESKESLASKGLKPRMAPLIRGGT